MSGAGLGQAHWIAKIYATLNEKELALTWLERGLATGAIGAFYKDDPVWDPIRSDPRFAGACRENVWPPLNAWGCAMNLRTFLTELRRRNVYKVAIA